MRGRGAAEVSVDSGAILKGQLLGIDSSVSTPGHLLRTCVRTFVGGLAQYLGMNSPVLLTRFLSNYPFTELCSRGWLLSAVSEPKVRRREIGPIRTAHFSWGNASITFDVNERDQMSEFATYARDEDIMLVAETADAVMALVASSPKASVEQLCEIEGVIEFESRWNAPAPKLSKWTECGQ